MENGKAKKVHHGHHHGPLCMGVPVRPHQREIEDVPPPPEDDLPHPTPLRHGVTPLRDPAGEAAANRHAIDSAGSYAVLIEGAHAAEEVAALLPRLSATPVAVIAAPGVDTWALPSLPLVRLSGAMDARALGVAMDDLALTPGSFLFLLGPGGAPDLGEDLRLGGHLDRDATAHRLMQGLAARVR